MGANNEPKTTRNTNGGGGREYTDRRRFGGDTGTATWNSITPGAIAGLVQSACSLGGCAILGTTSDGGALSVTVIIGTERIRDYPRDDKDVTAFTGWLAEQYT